MGRKRSSEAGAASDDTAASPTAAATRPLKPDPTASSSRATALSAQPPPEKYLTSHEDDEGEEYFASNWGTEFDAVEPHRLPLPWTFGDVWEETTSGAPYADATLNNVPINPGKLWPPAFMVRLPGYSTIWFRWSPRPAPKKDRKALKQGLDPDRGNGTTTSPVSSQLNASQSARQGPSQPASSSQPSSSSRKLTPSQTTSASSLKTIPDGIFNSYKQAVMIVKHQAFVNGYALGRVSNSPYTKAVYLQCLEGEAGTKTQIQKEGCCPFKVAIEPVEGGKWWARVFRDEHVHPPKQSKVSGRSSISTIEANFMRLALTMDPDVGSVATIGVINDNRRRYGRPLLDIEVGQGAFYHHRRTVLAAIAKGEDPMGDSDDELEPAASYDGAAEQGLDEAGDKAGPSTTRPQKKAEQAREEIKSEAGSSTAGQAMAGEEGEAGQPTPHNRKKARKAADEDEDDAGAGGPRDQEKARQAKGSSSKPSTPHAQKKARKAADDDEDEAGAGGPHDQAKGSSSKSSTPHARKKARKAAGEDEDEAGADDPHDQEKARQAKGSSSKELPPRNRRRPGRFEGD